MLDPTICLAQDPGITYTLSSTVRQLQSRSKPHLAVGLMVWVHTLRAVTRPELRKLGRSMWRELSRGFSCAAEVAEDASLFLGIKYDARDTARFPIGLTPDPV